MKNKVKSTLISLLFVILLVSPAMAQKALPDANIQPGIPGAGGVGDGDKAGNINKENLSKIKEIKRKIDALEMSINKNTSEISSIEQKKTQDKLIKKLQKEVKGLEKDLEAFTKKGKPISEIESKLSAKQSELDKAMSEYEVQITELKTKLNCDKEKKQELEEEIKTLETSSDLPVELNKTTLFIYDQYDVQPHANAYLQDGALLAWGIPSIPSIPRSQPKKERQVQEKQVSDETYNALRSVENQSEQITDSDKSQFLNELNSRAAMSN